MDSIENQEGNGSEKLNSGDISHSPDACKTNSHTTKARQRRAQSKYVAFCGVIVTVIICLVVVPLIIAAEPKDSEITTAPSVAINMGDLVTVKLKDSEASAIPATPNTADLNMITSEQAIEFTKLWLESFNDTVDWSAFSFTALLFASNPDPMYIPTWEIYVTGGKDASLWVPAFYKYGEFEKWMAGDRYPYSDRQKEDFDLKGYIDYHGGWLDDYGRPFIPSTYINNPAVFSVSINAYSGQVVGMRIHQLEPSVTVSEEEIIFTALSYIESFSSMYGLGLEKYDISSWNMTATFFNNPSPTKTAIWFIAIEDFEGMPLKAFNRVSASSFGASSWDVASPGFLFLYFDGYSGQFLGSGYSTDGQIPLPFYWLMRPSIQSKSGKLSVLS